MVRDLLADSSRGGTEDCQTMIRRAALQPPRRGSSRGVKMDPARNVFVTEKAEKGFLPSKPLVWRIQDPSESF